MGRQQPLRVLVVGATSAIAAEVCVLLAARGDCMYLLGGRSQPKLDALRQRLGTQCLAATAADFDALSDNEALVKTAIATLGGLDWCIVATGYLGDQLQTERDVAHAEQVLRTNLLSVVSILIPVANHFDAHGGGHIAVMSSVAGDRGRPRNYTYASAKAALNIYLEGLRSRLWSKGTQVHVFKLGPVDTPMTTDHPKNFLFAQPQQVASSLLAHILAGSKVAYVPWYWRPIMTLVKNLPEALFQQAKSLSGR